MLTTPIPVRRLAAIASSGLLIAGCGGSSKSDPPGGTPASAEREFAAFVECMRQQGVDMAEPQGPADGSAVELPDGVTPEQAREATEKCRDKLPKLRGTDSDPEQVAEMRDSAVRFAECMREHGIEMPDPKVENGRVLMDPGAADLKDPATQKASAACRRHLPRIGAR